MLVLTRHTIYFQTDLNQEFPEETVTKPVITAVGKRISTWHLPNHHLNTQTRGKQCGIAKH